MTFQCLVETDGAGKYDTRYKTRVTKPEHLSSSHWFVCVDWDLREEEQNKAVHIEARSALTRRKSDKEITRTHVEHGLRRAVCSALNDYCARLGSLISAAGGTNWSHWEGDTASLPHRCTHITTVTRHRGKRELVFTADVRLSPHTHSTNFSFPFCQCHQTELQK